MHTSEKNILLFLQFGNVLNNVLSPTPEWQTLFRHTAVVFAASDHSVTYFFIKSYPSHTFPRALQSVTQTERVHVSLPIYAPLFSPRSSPSCNAGMVDSCLLIQCHGLFPLSVCLDVTFSGIIGWVSASVSRPTADIRTLTPWSSFPGMFPACPTNLITMTKTAWKSILSLDIKK